jgi:very-short-patch-repair endonuclease
MGVDGPIHAEIIEADAERERIFSLWGLRILRDKNEMVFRSLKLVLNAVLAACQAPPSDSLPETASETEGM